MAEMNTNSNNGDKIKKGKPSKMNLRVDFTPMVDMNMLLITFFMFCTTLSTPQVMDIVMPAKASDVSDPPQTIATKTVTLLLGENDQVFYYWGIPQYDDVSFLRKTDLSASGLRSIILESNMALVQQVNDLKQVRQNKEISNEEFKFQLSELKKSKESITVLIKPTTKSTYSNLIKTLDEMQICSVGKYMIIDPEEGDNYLITNYENSKLAQLK